MTKENRQYSETRITKRPEKVTTNNQRTDQERIKSSISLIGILTLVGLWIILSFKTNLFISEALICSSVIVGLVFMSYLDQNGVSREYVKN